MRTFATAALVLATAAAAAANKRVTTIGTYSDAWRNPTAVPLSSTNKVIELCGQRSKVSGGSTHKHPFLYILSPPRTSPSNPRSPAEHSGAYLNMPYQ